MFEPLRHEEPVASLPLVTKALGSPSRREVQPPWALHPLLGVSGEATPLPRTVPSCREGRSPRAHPSLLPAPSSGFWFHPGLASPPCSVSPGTWAHRVPVYHSSMGPKSVSLLPLDTSPGATGPAPTGPNTYSPSHGTGPHPNRSKYLLSRQCHRSPPQRVQIPTLPMPELPSSPTGTHRRV